jgi:hypothetical protein
LWSVYGVAVPDAFIYGPNMVSSTVGKVTVALSACTAVYKSGQLGFVPPALPLVWVASINLSLVNGHAGFFHKCSDCLSMHPSLLIPVLYTLAVVAAHHHIQVGAVFGGLQVILCLIYPSR